MVLIEELCILSSCFLSPMSKNSVLEECTGPVNEDKEPMKQLTNQDDLQNGC